MRFKRFAVAALAAALAFGASALAGDSEVKVGGVGGARIQWNPVKYRKQLADQIQPGLNWRFGSGNATRMEVTGMVLATEAGFLWPGEATCVLRCLSQESWALVLYEETSYQWQESYHHFGVVPFRVWKEKDPKKASEKLEVLLRSVTAKNRTQPPAAETVTPTEGAKPKVEMPSPVEHSKEAKAELEKAPWLEMEIRFGDLVGLVSFEAAEVGELKAKKADEKKTALSLRWPQFTAVRAKTELVETGTDVTLGLLKLADDPAQEFLVVVSGGEQPEIELKRIGKDEKSRTVEGKRAATKAAPKTITWECDGKNLTLHLFQADYVFPVP